VTSTFVVNEATNCVHFGSMLMGWFMHRRLFAGASVVS
jgi:hypothetical protein